MLFEVFTLKKMFNQIFSFNMTDNDKVKSQPANPIGI